VQAEAEQAEAECGGELEGLQEQIQELDAQLALGDMVGRKGGEHAGVQSGRKKKRGRRQEQQEEAAAAEAAGVQEEQPSTGKRKRRRRGAA
jgi:hypothetical protein